MRVSSHLVVLLTVFVSGLAGQDGPLPWAEPGEVGFSADLLAAIPSAMESYVEGGQVPGVVTMVARNGRIVHWDVVGYRDLASRDPLEPDDIFRIASMTKPITSVAIMMLVEEGLLSIDDAVSKHLPEFADMEVLADGERTPVDRPITVAHLLSHTAGLTYGFFGDTPVDRLYREASVFSEDLGHLSRTVASLPLLAQPGEIWNYSVATDVLGHLVEVISGMTLADFFARRIFEPLDMDDTGFFVPPDKTGDFVVLYARSEDGALEVGDSTTEGDYNQDPVLRSGGGGLVSTPSDYIRFAQMLLNGGELDGARLLSAETVELMRTNRLPERLIPIELGPYRWDGYGFGLGFSVLTDETASPTPDNDGVHRWWGYGSTYFWIDPEDELIGMVWTQLSPPTAMQIETEFQTLVYEARKH